MAKGKNKKKGGQSDAGSEQGTSQTQGTSQPSQPQTTTVQAHGSQSHEQIGPQHGQQGGQQSQQGGPQQPQQGGPQQQQQQQRGKQQGGQQKQQQQKDLQQGGSQQQQQHGGLQQQQQQQQQKKQQQYGDPQQQQGGQQPQQGGPQQQQQQRGKQKQQPQGDPQQGGSQQQQHGGPQQQQQQQKKQQQYGDPQQQQGGQQPQQGGPQQQQQGGPQQQQQQQRGKQQGGQQKQQQQKDLQQGGPQQQQQHGGLQQQQQQQQQKKQQQYGDPQQQQGGQQPQQGGPQQQQQQRGKQKQQPQGDPQQGGSQQQQHGGPQQQQQQQKKQQQYGDPQQQQGGQQPQQGGPQQQQQQRGKQKQQQQGDPQQGGSQQQQHRGPQQQQQKKQQQYGDPQQQQGGQQPQLGGPQQQKQVQQPQQGGTQPQQRVEPVAQTQQGAISQTTDKMKSLNIGQGDERDEVSSCQLLTSGPGTLGRKVVVDTNYLELSVNNIIKTAYQYDVKIEPNMPKRMMPAAFECWRLKCFPKTFIAYDGRASAYAPMILNNLKTLKVGVIDPENNREKEFEVKVSDTINNAIDLTTLQRYHKSSAGLIDKPLRAIQVVDVLLRTIFSGRSISTGRSLFCRPDRPLDLGEHYELWTGLFQSAILGDQVLLNVDVVHKAFPKPVNIMEIVRGMRNVNINQGLDRRQTDDLQNQLRGLRITYRPHNTPGSVRTYKFSALVDTPVRQTFTQDDKTKITVQAYFKKIGYTIQFPNVPLLSVGNAVKTVYLPAELCEITANQVSNKKCTDMMTRNMIKAAATSTSVRRDKINELLRKFNHNSTTGIKEFGLSVGNNFIQVPARILDSPFLQYGNREIKPNNGDWMREPNTFIAPTKLVINNWAILILDRATQVYDCQKFAEYLCQVAQKQGMNMENNPKIEKLQDSRLLDTRLQQFAKDKLTLVFVIISSFGNDYSKTKQTAEIKYGVLTQCIKGQTIEKKGGDMSTLLNILLKVNTKLTGTNHKIADKSKTIVMKQPFMFIGADVTHPSPDQNDIPSVVGVAASRDINGFHYNMYWRLQDARKEEIEDLQDIVRSQLQLFLEIHKRLPSRIMYYRDGVSEGQFARVKNMELRAIRAACYAMVGDSGPKINITFIVVQKRHHTRLFPNAKFDIGDRKNKNVPPGTIVDTKITYPNENQFFLVSHQSVQGVAKPTKYNILVDDSNLSSNDLQALTYHLCYLFTRCNRSVSYPAPTYYAHLAAYRGRVYIDGFPKVDMNDLQKEFKSRTVKDVICKDKPMYFV